VGTCAQPVAAGLREHFGIVWPDPTHAATCPAHTARPQAPKAWPHAPASDAELHTMTHRLERFERLIPLAQYQARDARCPDWRRDRYESTTEPKTDKDRARINQSHEVTPCL